MGVGDRLRRLDDHVLGPPPPAPRADALVERRWRRRALLALPTMALVVWLVPGSDWDVVVALLVFPLLAGPYVELLVAHRFRPGRR